MATTRRTPTQSYHAVVVVMAIGYLIRRTARNGDMLHEYQPDTTRRHIATTTAAIIASALIADAVTTCRSTVITRDATLRHHAFGVMAKASTDAATLMLFGERTCGLIVNNVTPRCWLRRLWRDIAILLCATGYTNTMTGDTAEHVDIYGGRGGVSWRRYRRRARRMMRGER